MVIPVLFDLFIKISWKNNKINLRDAKWKVGIKGLTKEEKDKIKEDKKRRTKGKGKQNEWKIR
jgi:hypothetical protein